MTKSTSRPLRARQEYRRAGGVMRPVIVREMRAAGLVDELPWAYPHPVSPKERARLAKKLSQGKPLSEIIIEDREDRA